MRQDILLRQHVPPWALSKAGGSEPSFFRPQGWFPASESPRSRHLYPAPTGKPVGTELAQS